MKRLLIAVILLCFPTALFAWNDTGHMTVALIAWRQLNDAQKEKVGAILKSHPHYALFLSANKPDGLDENTWAFVRAATWPDFVRPSRPGMGREGELFKGPEITRYHQGPWHYITIPWVPPFERKTMSPTTLPGSARLAAPNAGSEKSPEPNIATAFEKESKDLAAADSGAQTKPVGEDRAVALAWVEHLVGDVHQPLHAGSMFNAAHPTGDKGGNDVVIRSEGGVWKLHSYWDECLGTSDSYVAIDFLATQILNDPQLAQDKLPELARDTTFDSWIDESFQYLGAIAYLNGRLRTASSSAWENKEITADEVPSLPPGYAANAHELARRRAALAGYRLAAEIKKAIGE